MSSTVVLPAGSIDGTGKLMFQNCPYTVTTTVALLFGLPRPCVKIALQSSPKSVNELTSSEELDSWGNSSHISKDVVKTETKVAMELTAGTIFQDVLQVDCRSGRVAVGEYLDEMTQARVRAMQHPITIRFNTAQDAVIAPELRSSTVCPEWATEVHELIHYQGDLTIVVDAGNPHKHKVES